MSDSSKNKNFTTVDSLAILKSTPDLYLILDPDFNIIEASDAYLKATMVERENILGKNIFEVFPDNPNDPTATGVKNLKTSLERVLKRKEADTMPIQKYDIRQQGTGEFEERYWSPVNSPVLDEEGEIKYILHRAEDVTRLIRLKKIRTKQEKVTEELRNKADEMEIEIYKRSQEIEEANKQLRAANDELERIALFDVLTGLANRKQLGQGIKLSLELAKQNHWKIAVLFLDLDQFKLVNDTLGHKVGDHLLQIIGKRLRSIMPMRDLVARLGGDEFVIILNRISHTADVAAVAQRILKKISEPIVIDNHKLFVSTSIGISIYPENGEDDVTLLKHADIAMYFAKQSGRNLYHFCTTEMINNIKKKMDLESQIRDSILNKKFVLYYQPQIDLKTGMITGVEALLRLPQTTGDLLLPKDFLTIAEDTGLIIPIGEWVLTTACLQYKKWKQTIFNGKNDIRLTINISPRQLRDPDFFNSVKNVIEKTKISPHHLEFEITENPIITDIDMSFDVIRKLKKLGAHIALDDFGVGYSSLSYLRQFQIDTLKIDQSLIKTIPTDITDAEIISSIITMAHAMQISVIAEGAELKEQIRFLIDHNCDKIQSYYFCKPLSANEMTKLLEENKNWKLEGAFG